MAKPSILDSIETEAQKKGKSEVQVIPVKGTVVSRYAQACDDKKQAEGTIKELAPQLQEAGVKFVFGQNVEHGGRTKEMISSVNLVDKDSEQAAEGTVDRVQFSFVRKDLKNDDAQVKAVFSRLRNVQGKPVKWEDYCEWEIVSKFDTKVFMKKDAAGTPKFNEERYKAFMEAIKEVAEKFKVPMPLISTKVLVPKPDFHDRRFADFDYEANLTLMSVLPTSLSLEAVRATPAEAAE